MKHLYALLLALSCTLHTMDRETQSLAQHLQHFEEKLQGELGAMFPPSYKCFGLCKSKYAPNAPLQKPPVLQELGAAYRSDLAAAEHRASCTPTLHSDQEALTITAVIASIQRVRRVIEEATEHVDGASASKRSWVCELLENACDQPAELTHYPTSPYADAILGHFPEYTGRDEKTGAYYVERLYRFYVLNSTTLRYFNRKY